MLFSSLEFLYGFLPLTLILYFCCPPRLRNGILLALSLLFYAYGEPVYLALMVFTVAADYALGLWIAQRMGRGGSGRGVLLLGVALNLTLLGLFKYYGLLASVLGLPPPGWSLPVGISFYTFQALSYLVDVYRREVEAQRSLVRFGAYVTLFPQLIAGPIVRYSEVEAQLRERRCALSRVGEGVATFCVGLAKKVLLANGAGEACEALLGGATVTTLGAWAWLCFYALQIYFDFSGYSDMAVGLGRMLGFEFPVNFRYPYMATDVTDFWRRWHVTLSSWFREYVYIPLGGNRHGRWKTVRNLLVTWTLTGLWHGASLNFLLWGFYFFVLLTLEKLVLGRWISHLPILARRAYALLAIGVGWLIFASDGATANGMALGRAMLGLGVPLTDGRTVYELCRRLLPLSVMLVGATPLPRQRFVAARRRFPRATEVACALLCLLSLALCTAYLVDSGYNPFLYFRF